MWGIRRLRFATGVDDDLRPFYDAFRDDPVIGKAVRAAAELRVRRGAAAVGGAVERRLRAADRVRARGRDPAPHDRRARPPLPADRAARRADAGRGRRGRAGAAGGDGPRSRARAHAAARGRRGGRAGAWTCSPPTRCRAGGGCARSPASGRGRSRCSRSTARAATTACRRATSATSSSSAASHRQPAGARRRAGRARVLRAATASGRGWPASTCASPPRAACCPSVLRDRPRVEPLARPGTRSSAPARRSAAA